MTEISTVKPPEEAPKPAQRMFGGMTPKEASAKAAEARRKKREEAASTDRARSRSPLDALRDLMARDPDKYAAGLGALVEKGDPRSIQVMQALFREEQDVKIPRAERLVRALDRDQRRALLLELERKGLAQYLPAAPDPAAHAASDDERLAGS